MNICCFFTKYSSEPRAANDSFYYNISYRVFHTKKILFQEKRKNYSVLSCDFAKCKTKHDNVASLQMAWGQQSYKKADRDGWVDCWSQNITTHTHTHPPPSTHSHTHTDTHTEATPIASTVPAIINHQVQGDIHCIMCTRN